MAKSKNKTTDPILSELVAIKQLLVVALIRDGVKQRQIAAALGIHESKLSRALPKGLGASVKNGRDETK